MNTNELIQKLTNEGASKPLWHPLQQSLLWVIGIVFYLAVFLAFDGFRSDITLQLDSVKFLIEAALLAAIGITASFSAFCLSRPDDFQLPWVKYIPGILLFIWAVFAFSSAGDDLQLTNLIRSVNLMQVDCPIHIIAFSAVPAVVIFILVRMGAAIHYSMAGIMSTLSVTAFAYLFMRLVEGNDNPAHLLIWHALPILALCLLGMFVARKTFRW